MLYTCITTWSHINLRSYARRSMFEKGRKFSPLFLWSEEWFCRPLNNCSYEVNYLDVGDQPIFTRVFFLQNISRTRVTIHTYCSSKIYMLEATPTCYLKQQRKVLLSSSFHYWIKCDHKKLDIDIDNEKLKWARTAKSKWTSAFADIDFNPPHNCCWVMPSDRTLQSLQWPMLWFWKYFRRKKWR
jgi:hypothetical protein